MAKPSTSQKPIAELRSAWQAFDTQIAETMDTDSLDRAEYTDIQQLGQACTQLGLQIQLWARDATAPRSSVSRPSTNDYFSQSDRARASKTRA
jgi:hypothetical protein